MVPGGQSPNTGEAAIYMQDEAIGWDECFPTVSSWDASGTTWGRRLRDHGDLWGRKWGVDSATSNALTTTYSDRMFAFTRELRLHGRTLRASYRVTNRTSAELPFLWALHDLLVVTPQDRIVLPEVTSVRSSYLSLDGRVEPPNGSLPWPGPSGGCAVALDEVHPATTNMAAKLYASGLKWAAVGHDGEWLRISWDGALDHLGLWYNYGAWPSRGDLHHIAIEPTTSPSDHLGQALNDDGPGALPAGQAIEWTVAFEFLERLA
jgi:galactose mutarotase-like enzyme